MLLIVASSVMAVDRYRIERKLRLGDVHHVKSIDDMYGYANVPMLVLDYVDDMPEIEQYAKQHKIKIEYM